MMISSARRRESLKLLESRRTFPQDVLPSRQVGLERGGFHPDLDRVRKLSSSISDDPLGVLGNLR
jgi:hypothetical protein